MKIAVVDDDKAFANKVVDILRTKYQMEDIKVFHRIKDYAERKDYFDCVLLDIEVENENGIEFIKKNCHVYTYIIYISSHSELVFDSFNHNVIGFIPKVHVREQLLNKLNMVETKLYHLRTHVLPTISGYDIRIREDHIVYVYLEYSSVYMKVLNRKSSICINYRSLKNVKQKFSETFFQINRTTIVNIRHIKRVVGEKHSVICFDSTQFVVSTRLWSSFLQVYEKVRYYYD